MQVLDRFKGVFDQMKCVRVRTEWRTVFEFPGTKAGDESIYDGGLGKRIPRSQ
jgi:hypothetical protein